MINGFGIYSRLKVLGLNHATSINTFTSLEELSCLLDLADQVPDASTVVEIGSYLGASTCFLAAGIMRRNCSMLCIDTWNNETMPDGIRDTFSEFSKNLQPAWDCIQVLRKDTRDVTANDLPKNIALAFLDGDHSFEATSRDFSLVSDLIPIGGIIAFHDTATFKGVSQVLGNILATGRWRMEGCCVNLCWVRRVEFLH